MADGYLIEDKSGEAYTWICMADKTSEQKGKDCFETRYERQLDGENPASVGVRVKKQAIDEARFKISATTIPKLTSPSMYFDSMVKNKVGTNKGEREAQGVEGKPLVERKA